MVREKKLYVMVLCRNIGNMKKRNASKLGLATIMVLSIMGVSSCKNESVSSSFILSSSSIDSSSIIASYKVTFIVDGEEIVVEARDGYVTTPKTQRAHKRFAGWNIDDKATTGMFFGDPFIKVEDLKTLGGDDESITIYAIYSNVATVVFHTGGSKTQIAELDSIFENASNVMPTKTTNFIGWSNSKDSSTVLFENDAKITYSAVAKYLDQDLRLELYPVYQGAIPEKEIKVADYFAPDTLPEIHINTENGLAIDDKSLIDPTKKKGSKGEIPVYNYVGATVNVTNGEEGTDLASVPGQVKVRGNYTSTYAKKPIRIKFDKKQAMLGLNNGNKCKSWVLLAEWKDTSMLRNSLAGFIGNSLLESDGYYCSDFRFVKVYLNGEYNGVYVLAEQQQINQYRVDIPESTLATDGVDTGYMLEFDGYYKNEPAIQTYTVDYHGMKTLSQGFTVVNDIMNQEQHDYIAKVTQTVFNVVYDATKIDHSDLKANPYHAMDEDGNYIVDTSILTPEMAVSKVVDVTSLVDMYILHELFEDRDIGWSSFYMSIDMSKEGNHKLTFEAPWDFDYAIGNNTYSNAMKASLANRSKMISDGRLLQSGRSYIFAKDTKLTASDFTWTNKDALYAKSTDNPWFAVCSNQKWFWNKVYVTWNKMVKAGVFDKASEMMYDLTIKNEAAFAENFAKWTGCMGKKLDTYQPDIVQYFVNQRQASDYLRIWFDTRVEGLNLAFSNALYI